MRIRLRFRTKMLFWLLVLVIGTTAAVGISSNLIARRTAADLTGQILEQTAARIEQQIVSLLQAAAAEGELTRRILLNDQLPPYRVPTSSDFSIVTLFFHELMEVAPHLSFVSLGLETTGEYCHAERKPDGSLSLQDCVRNAQGKIERSDFRFVDGQRQRYNFNPDWDYDPRRRPYYKAARDAGKQVWTDTYIFINDPFPPTPGVTCANPVYDGKGALVGVVSVDFSLKDLCSFVKQMQIGKEGFAIVKEERGDGSLQVIALPDAANLIDVSGKEHRLIPNDRIKDDRIRALAKRLEETLGVGHGSRHGQVRFEQGKRAFVGTYRRLAGQNLPDWYVCAVVPEAEIMGGVWRSNRITMIIGLVSLLVAVVVSVRVSTQVARPLEELARETGAIGRLQLDSRPPVRSDVREIHRLAAATEEMKTGLRSFQKFVPAELVRSLLTSGREARLGGERRIVTICFSDIAEFTPIAESLAPEMLVELLSEHLAILSQQIQESGGTIDKYMGDAVMAFWNAPLPIPDHALRACQAVVRSRERLKMLQQKSQTAGKPVFHARFGVHTGEALVGNMGSEARLNYTVIGNNVNLASRLEGLNKHFGTEIILSDDTYQLVRPSVVARPLNWVAVKGKSEATLVFELLGMKGETDRTAEELTEICADALSAYSKQDWSRSIELCEQALRMRPQDRPSQMLIARCRTYREKPPGEHWDKAHRMDSK